MPDGSDLVAEEMRFGFGLGWNSPSLQFRYYSIYFFELCYGKVYTLSEASFSGALHFGLLCYTKNPGKYYITVNLPLYNFNIV